MAKRNGEGRPDNFDRQLLKWIGNKQRFASQIVSYFPRSFKTYFEPFLGSGAVVATLAPRRAVASDIFAPLMDIWRTLSAAPDTVKGWYAERWEAAASGNKVVEYARIRASFNASPNAADLIFLCRACYGGVVRFRQSDGYFSTPCGVHPMMRPETFAKRVDEWRLRLAHVKFDVMDYRDAMKRAKPGDLIYCDPPYFSCDPILYGAHKFSLEDLFNIIAQCKTRGVHIALTIDGTKRSGSMVCEIPVPTRLFKREILIQRGQSMLRRFQNGRARMKGEAVADRLLLTY